MSNPTAGPERIAAIRERLEAAHAEVTRICREGGTRAWRMTIPAQMDDSDLLIGCALTDAIELLDALAAAQGAGTWQPIATAPKGKRDVLDLWCVGLRDEIEFYCPVFCATGTMDGDEHLYQGRVANVQWRDGAWRPKHGLRLHALTVTPTHWMRKPEAPHE